MLGNLGPRGNKVFRFILIRKYRYIRGLPRTPIDSRRSRRDRDLRSVITAAINHTGKLHRGLLVMRVLLADE